MLALAFGIGATYVCVAVLVQWGYGGLAGVRALTPQRVHLTHKALLQCLSAVLYLPLAIQASVFYRTASPQLLLKHVPYGSHGLSMDIHSPEKAQHLDAWPVVIFVYGGAWASGDKSLYPLLGRSLANMGYLVLVPNYRIHPHGSVEDMVEDVQEMVLFAQQHGHAYGGDPTQLVLAGHSAGAHLCSLALCVALTQPHAAPSCLAAVVACVCLAGPYSIADHYLWETKRGVELISSMGRIMGGPERWPQNSPSELVERNALRCGLLPRFAILHGYAHSLR